MNFIFGLSHLLWVLSLSSAQSVHVELWRFRVGLVQFHAGVDIRQGGLCQQLAGCGLWRCVLSARVDVGWPGRWGYAFLDVVSGH